MNKFGMVLGLAAVATLAGCKDPDYKYGNAPASQNDVKAAEAQPIVVEPAPAPVKPVVEKPVVIEADVSKPAPAVQSTPAPAAAETTTYIVQRGDSLSKISKKYNITIAALRKANPNLKNDVVKIGQKLQLPGKVEVGAQTVPAGAIAKPAKRVYTPYTGATKEYVVKSGDTLGAIAYGNGINIRQLKELNGLTKDSLRIGQKLKVPATKQVAAAAPKAASKKEAKKAAEPVKAAAAKPVEQKAPEAAAEVQPVAAEPAPAAEPAVPAPAEPAAAAEPASTTSYVVQEGDDITGVSIRWGVSAAAIRELNNLPEDAQLVPGQVLKLPADVQQ